MTKTMEAVGAREDAATDAKIDPFEIDPRHPQPPLVHGYLKQLGPYIDTAWNTGESVDENSADRKAFGAALDELASKCSS